MGSDFHMLQQQDRISYEAVVYERKGLGDFYVKVFKTSMYFPETNREIWRGPLNEDTKSLLKALGVKL